MKSQEEKITEGIFALCQLAYATSQSKGFHDGEPTPLDKKTASQKIALIHEEVSEMLGELRSGRIDTYRNVHIIKGQDEFTPDERIEDPKPEGFFVEGADAMIRIADLVACYPDGALKLASALRQKMEYNKSRPHKHGRKF